MLSPAGLISRQNAQTAERFFRQAVFIQIMNKWKVI